MLVSENNFGMMAENGVLSRLYQYSERTV